MYSSVYTQNDMDIDDESQSKRGLLTSHAMTKGCSLCAGGRTIGIALDAGDAKSYCSNL